MKGDTDNIVIVMAIITGILLAFGLVVLHSTIDKLSEQQPEQETLEECVYVLPAISDLPDHYEWKEIRSNYNNTNSFCIR